MKRLIDVDELIEKLESQQNKFSYFYGGNDQFVICIEKIIIPIVKDMQVITIDMGEEN